MERRTQRLHIRSFRRADIVPYAQLVADPRVMAYLGDGRPQSLAQATDYVVDCIERDQATGIARYAIELRETGAFIGFCGFKALSGWIDFGYRFSPEHWGKGYATEAGVAVIDYGWETLGLTTIVAGVMPDNAASAAVLLKLNFEPRACPEGLDTAFDWFALKRPATEKV